MHSATIFFALAAVATASASAVIGGIGANVIARPSYQTSYGVSDRITGDQKSAVEVRDGDVTKGSYSLVQPDGVLRTVNYISTPLGGFQAQVINKGVAAHPAVIGAGAVGLGGVGLGIGSGLLGARSVVGGIATPIGLGLGAPLGINTLGVNTLGVNTLGVNTLGLGLGSNLALGGLGAAKIIG